MYFNYATEGDECMNFGNVDFSALAKGKQAWDAFKRNHPKFPEFLKYIGNRGVSEGTEIDITVKYPNGQNVNSSIKVKPEDVQLFNSMKDMLKKL